MLVVKVELHSARTGDVSTIAQMEIVNDGSGGVGVGNYDVGIGTLVGRVLGYPRISGIPVWCLVELAIRAALTCDRVQSPSAEELWPDR